ncbi:MAG: TonB-dependent receptor plug domain-containing protein, partial [Cyclobacteriaceae bacterium]|nr:TonB-dependent receptor plug domain-containing protein [Cyclobacteriaceae bacterium]
MNNYYQFIYGLNSRILQCKGMAQKNGKYLMKYFLFVFMFIMSYSIYAQERTVSGTVTSADDGSTLPGVNVVIKGTTTGVATDIDGKYTISVSESDVLVFSQVGMKPQEITVGTRTIINVSMVLDTDILDEVVVTALGVQQQKRSLGYSIQQVKGESIAETQRPNFMVSLQGRVAGLNMVSTSGLPGSSTSITLRGIASITGDNQPLIVVDGLPIDNRTINEHHLVTNGDNRNNDYLNRAADINPNDIESISILKGPEAAALYGQDGASGAIIITTKKGAQGAA